MRNLSVYVRCFTPRMLLAGAYVFMLAGAGSAFACLLATQTSYGLTCRLWFAALVGTVLATIGAPLVGSVAGGRDYDLATAKELHLCGLKLFCLQIRTLAVAVGFLFGLVLVGVCSALLVSLVASLGPPSLIGHADLITERAVLRLLLALVLGMPLLVLLGWIAALVLRSSYWGAVVVEATLLVYLLVGRNVPLDAVLAREAFRFSPWGAFFAATVGDYRFPRLALAPVLDLVQAVVAMLGWALVFLVGAWLVIRSRDIEGVQR